VKTPTAKSEKDESSLRDRIYFLKIITLFIIAIIPGSHASMCILFRASEGGGFSWQRKMN
jgi:hypothetical protein